MAVPENDRVSVRPRSGIRPHEKMALERSLFFLFRSCILSERVAK